MNLQDYRGTFANLRYNCEQISAFPPNLREDQGTSAYGVMRPAPPYPELHVSGTVAWPVEDQRPVGVQQAATVRAPLEERAEAQSTSSAIMELRRLSGLTWQQLAELFGVVRRSLHFWASGKPLNAQNETRLRRLLEAIHKSDRGSAAQNRAMLLHERDGVVPLDLLARGQYEDFTRLVGVGPGRRKVNTKPLSPEAWEARKPLRPEDLVGALHDPVHRDVGKVRPARTVKIKK